MIDSSDVRKINTNLIRTVLWTGGEHTKQSIARDTGLSVATCNTLLNELEKNKEVFSEQRQLNGVGRSTSVYQINESYESLLCVRFEPTSDGKRVLSCDVLSMLGKHIFQEHNSYDRLDAELIVDKISGLIDKFPNVSCVLIGVSAIVDKGVLHMSDIAELEEVPLLDMVRGKVTDLPIHMAYDCSYRVYGLYKEAGYSQETLTLLFCLKNILPGTASVVNGAILNGKNGFAGMTGYMPFDVDRDEQIRLIAQGKGLPYLTKAAAAAIAVLNPDAIICMGNVIDDGILEQIFAECAKSFPETILPKFKIVEDPEDFYYLVGMYWKAVEIKSDLSFS